MGDDGLNQIAKGVKERFAVFDSVVHENRLVIQSCGGTIAVGDLRKSEADRTIVPLSVSIPAESRSGGGSLSWQTNASRIREGVPHGRCPSVS